MKKRESKRCSTRLDCLTLSVAAPVHWWGSWLGSGEHSLMLSAPPTSQDRGKKRKTSWVTKDTAWVLYLYIQYFEFEAKRCTCSNRCRCSWHLLFAVRWFLALSLTSCSSSVLTTSLTPQSSLPSAELFPLICIRSRTFAMDSFSSFTRASL